MDFSDAQYAQLIIALLLGAILFLVAYVASEKYTVYLIVATLPFQAITSGYGTLNTVLIYMVGLIFLLRGRLKKFPLLWSALLILFVLLLSTSQAHKSTYLDHLFYLITITANFVLFYMVYNYFIRTSVRPQSAFNLFLFCGFLVLLFSTVKLVFNFDFGVTFGIDELTATGNLEEKQRFIGSFEAAGINGAFHATQLLLIAFVFMFDRRALMRALLIMLFVGNAAFLVATGSRGAFLAGIGGFLLMMFIFARHIGVGRIIVVGTMSVVLFAAASVVIVKYSDYGVLFERLAATEFEGFTPDTRDFSYTLDRIPEEIVLGHGPRMRLMNEALRRVPGYTPIAYPHNLYLHILFTAGVLGLIAYLSWFLALAARYIRPLKYKGGTTLLSATPRMALLVLIVFLVDELKIEFLRFNLADYQQFMFALWAMLLALSDRAYMEGRDAHASAASRTSNQRQGSTQN